MVVFDDDGFGQVGVNVEVFVEQDAEVLEKLVVGVGGQGGDVDGVAFGAELHVDVPEVLVVEEAFDFELDLLTVDQLITETNFFSAL